MYTKAKRHGAKPSHASSPTDRSLLPMPSAGRGSHGPKLSDLSEAGLGRESGGRGSDFAGARYRERFICSKLLCCWLPEHQAVFGDRVIRGRLVIRRQVLVKRCCCTAISGLLVLCSPSV